MSKELENLTIIREYSHHLSQVGYLEINHACDDIKKELQRLEAIDNAKPSQALEDLDNIVRGFNETSTGMYGLGEVVVGNELEHYYKNELNTIKQALIKAQEQEKVLEILFEKEVDIFVLKIATSVEHYNKTQKLEQYHLTEEEFGLLKRWIENGNL